MSYPVLWLVVFLFVSTFSISTASDGPKNPDKIFDAIREVHEQLDDDNDGEINESESADYMKNELKEPSEKRKQNFHNNDASISVDDLWKKWIDSEVHNWNVEDVVKWLKETVKLPKYEKTFRDHNVIGKNIPQLATSKAQYVHYELKIMNALDRSKIYLRASDLILFGAINVKEESNEGDKNFLAIKAIHSRLDDDLSGEIDKQESDEYMRDELNGSNTERHDSFHSNDELISVEDLWQNWQLSVAYNWTNEDVISWLKNIVGLPQYEKAFKEKNVDGKSIPMLATNTSNLLHKELGVLNATHRRKIYLRASDIILFGPSPNVQQYYFSDMFVLCIVIVASTLCFFAVQQHSSSKKQIDQLKTNMVHLKQAEQMLKELQENEDYNTIKEREVQLRGEIEEAKKEFERLHQQHSKYEEEKTKLQLVEQEVTELRAALAKAENAVKYNEIRTPTALLQLLIVTYKKEVQHFQQKKQQALAQMQEAKEACEKVNKTKRAVFGSLRLAHGQSIDMVDQKILNAKSALAEVTKNLQERQYRWQQIEFICNFSIINNDEMNRPIIGKSMLTDTMIFGSKGRLDLLDSQITGLSENELLDSEVEAITKRGKFACTSTESSSSQESIHARTISSSDLSKQTAPASPALAQKAIRNIIPTDHLNGKFNGNTSPTSSPTSSTCPEPEKFEKESKSKQKTLEKIYRRSNTSPNAIVTQSLEDLSADKSKNNKKGKTRPSSLIKEKNIRKQKTLISLSRLTNSP